MSNAGSDIVEQIYDSVANYEYLHDVMDVLRQKLAAHASVVFAYSSLGPMPWSLSGIGDSVFAAYEAHYHHFDLFKDTLLASGQLRSGAVFTEQTLVAPDALRRSPLVQELLVPSELGPLLGLPAHVAKSGSLVEFAFYRRPGAEPFNSNDVRFLRSLAPHLERACRLRMRLARSAPMPVWTEDWLERLPWGVVLLDQRGRTVFANREAQRIMRAGDGFTLDRLGMGGPHHQTRRQLDCAFGRARGQSAVGSDVRIERPSGAPAYLVTIVPMNIGNGLRLRSDQPCVAVHIVDPLARPTDDGDRLATMFALSAAEQSVALGLVRGLSLTQIADQNRVAQSTIKTQLLSLFAKTGTNRQSHLVALILRSLSLPRRDFPSSR